MDICVAAGSLLSEASVQLVDLQAQESASQNFLPFVLKTKVYSVQMPSPSVACASTLVEDGLWFWV